MSWANVAVFGGTALGGLLGGKSAGQTASSGTQQSISQVKPPDFVANQLGQGVGYADQAFGAGGPEQYPNRSVVPFSAQTEQSLGQLTALGQTPGQVVDASQNLLGSTLRGDYLNPQTNPYLENTFNTAADLTRNRLSSEFARSGRNVDASAPARSNELQLLASNIYGQNYANERNRQTQSLSQVPNINRERFFGPNVLGGVGATVEGKGQQLINDQMQRWNYEQNRPEMALDNYIGRLSGLSGGYNSSSQSSTGTLPQGNALAGFMGGAQLGQGLGQMLGGLLQPQPQQNTYKPGQYDPGGLFGGTPGDFWSQGQIFT